MSASKLENFIQFLAESLSDGTFVKATVGDYKGREEHLQKVSLRLIETRRGARVQFVRKYSDREIAANVELPAAPEHVIDLVGEGFRAVHLFTTGSDLMLSVTRKGKALVSRSAATFQEPPNSVHDREKQHLVNPLSKYLNLLGITRPDGTVRDKAQSKFRQIDRFVAMIDRLVDEAGLPRGKPIRIVDMGCGKGYLTFALYDHLSRNRGLDVRVTGIEAREHLVRGASEIAESCGFEGLRFETGMIGSADPGSPDILIALHACDTATDEAIFQGISSASKLIVTAPCCHKELRPQLAFPVGAAYINKFGLLVGREAETVTDAIRAALLEKHGYVVKMTEFVSPEHTPKNNLITALLTDGANPETATDHAASLMQTFGIRKQTLASLLDGLPTPGTSS